MTEYQRALFIHCARQWIGTPFHLNARVIGQGVDCAQLIIAAALQAGLLQEEPPALRLGPGLLMPRKMRAILERYMRERDQANQGDVLWLNTRRNLPLHLVIVTDQGILHASHDAGRVIETRRPAELSVAAIWSFDA